MDSVRFGRALGVGARLAGKTLAEAVDAATAADPTSKEPNSCPHGAVLPAKEAGGRAVQQARTTSQGVRRGGKRFGEAVWGPMARASGVLWLEVTGVFFGLVAILGIDGMWINRRALQWVTSAHEVREHFVIGGMVALVFGYFAISSFVRAARGTRSYR